MDIARAFMDAFKAFLKVSFDNIIKRSTRERDNIINRGRLYFKKFDERKILIILFVIIVGLLSIFYNHDMSRKNDLIKEISSDYDYLYDNYLALNMSYYGIQNNASILNGYYMYIKSLYNELYVNYNDLYDMYTDLSYNLDEINSQYFDSAERYDLLQNKYFLLLEDFNNLSSGYTETIIFLDELRNLKLNTILNNQENLEIGPRNNITLIYNISYAGYLEINFTSSVELFLWVGSSGGEPNYYTRYPSYPNISDYGSFQVPVAGSDIYLYFENPSLYIPADVIFSVKYFY